MKSKYIRIVLSAFAILAATLACQALSGDGGESPQPAVTSAAAEPTAAEPTAAEPESPTQPEATSEPEATDDPCIKWDEVTVAIKDQEACVRGLITKFDQGRNVGTRYSFSDKSKTFFLFSAKYEITNPNTGKTIAPGTCVEVTGRIDVESETPFINLDKLIDQTQTLEGFLFYEDTSVCE